jgi:hypothetical protein
MKPLIGLTVASLVLGMSAVACGDDEPAVCSSVDDLRSSIEDLREIDVTSSGALETLESGLETVEGNISTVRSDAQEEFEPQVEAVETSLAELRSTVGDARSDPSATTLSEAVSALDGFRTDVDTLIEDIQSTC